MSTSRFVRDNGLSICLLILFAITFVGQAVSGFLQFNQTQVRHQRPSYSFYAYLQSGEFLEVTFENWESEFLQMGIYIWLTTFLTQRGSAESKEPDKKESVDEDPRLHRNDPGVPLPVRKGGLWLRLYEYSLLIAFMLLFAGSFMLHLWGSARESCLDSQLHGQACGTVIDQLAAPEFWFESFQNWQSEFLSIALLVILSIFLRHRGSPESKPVHAAHSSTGKD